MSKQLLVFFSFSLFLMAQGFAAEGEKTSPIVAKVGTKNISLEEFNRRYDEVRRLVTNPPPKKIFLEDLVRYEMGVQEAEKKGVAKDPVVAERLRQELYKGLVELETQKQIAGINVSEDDMKNYYAENPEIRFSQILTLVKPNATPAERAAAEKRAKEILSEVKASKRPFEDLVKLYTDDPLTKSRGGDVGYQTRLTIQPNIMTVAEKLKVGEISNLLETPYGFHIIKVTGHRPYAQANKNGVKAAVLEKKKLAIFNGYMEGLRKKYDIKTFPEALR